MGATNSSSWRWVWTNRSRSSSSPPSSVQPARRKSSARRASPTSCISPSILKSSSNWSKQLLENLHERLYSCRSRCDGGDKAPGETVLGAVQAAREYGIGVYLVGREDVIRAELARHDTAGLDLPIIHTDEVIEMDEHPANAVRRKKNASMILALQQVRDGAAVGAVSAGNSGAMMAASLFTLKRIPGVERPALGLVFPTKDKPCLIIDMGANTDCKPEYLLQFALMGSIYMQRLFHVQAPRIGLLAN